MMRTGLFITFEGGEGAGKTTVLDRVEIELKKLGTDVVRTREPGGIRISEQIRTIILDEKHVEMDFRTEALLYAAARRQHLVEKVIPALKKGAVVLCDRFIDSSLVYQGYARGIGFDKIEKINEFAIEGYMPDLTLLFDVDPEVGLHRIQKDSERELNRLDKEQLDFHLRVREGYKLIQQQNKDRIKMIDANNSLEVVLQHVMKELQLFIANYELAE